MQKTRSLLCLLIFLAACSENPVTDSFESFDRRAMLRNIGENVIIPAFSAFAQKSQELEQSAAAFAATPSEQALGALQNKWRETAESWKRAEVFRIGPLDELTGSIQVGSFDFGSMYTMQAAGAVDKGAIESLIASGGSLDEAAIEQLPPAQKGFSALEYLLFDRQAGSAAVVQKFSSDMNAARRLSYLQALAKNLGKKSSAILAAWRPEGGNYLAGFISADGRDIGSSIGKLANQIVFLSETVRNEKIGRPLGLRTNGSPQPNSVEARESMNSVNFILHNLMGIENAFLGRGNSNLFGFDDLLNHLGAKNGDQLLSEKIVQRIADLRSKLEQIKSQPLDQAISSNKEAIEAIHRETQLLLVNLKVDMVNNIGVQITYQDSDGD